MEEEERPGGDEVAEVVVAAELVGVELLVGHGEGGDAEPAGVERLTVGEPEWPVRVGLQPFGDERPVGLGDHQGHRRVGGEQRPQRLVVEMVGVVVARRDDVDHVERAPDRRPGP